MTHDSESYGAVPREVRSRRDVLLWPTFAGTGEPAERYRHFVSLSADPETRAVRQLPGTAVNQVDGVEHVLVTAGTGLPTSGAILSKG